MQLNCLIVDDEPLALDLMESYVKRTPFLLLAGRCGSAVEVLEVIERQPVDVIFLDIQMPELNGLELSRIIGERTKIVFTTAFEQYALEGFRVDALDYLLKPINYAEFLKTANKALQWYELVRNRLAAGSELTSIFVKTDYKLLQIELNKILYVEGLKDYVKIYLENEAQPVVSLMSMKSLEELLPEKNFIRVHRSFIVQGSKIRVVERNRIVFGKQYIPISDSYKNKFQEFLSRRLVN